MAPATSSSADPPSPFGLRRARDKHLPACAAKPFILNTMNDEILKKLEARLDRRSFLRGSSLAAAALVGMAAASPLVAFAQAQDYGANYDKKKGDQPKKDDDSSSTDGKSDSKPYRTEGS